MPELSRSIEIEMYWQKLGCNFAQADRVFDDCMKEAKALLSKQGLMSYIENARFLGKMGRGPEPLLIYLEEAPGVAKLVGEEALLDLREFAHYMSTHTNFKAMVPFLQSSGAVARRLHSYDLFKQYIDVVRDMLDRTSVSVHGHHTTFPSPGLPNLLEQAPNLLGALSLEGFRNWVEYGIKYYNDHPQRQEEYFSLESSDAMAVLQRERHGTLLVDNERKLDSYFRALWNESDYLVPYSVAFDDLRKPMPYFDEDGIRLPDVYDDLEGVKGIDRYRAAIAHMAAHRRWSQKMIVDNWSPPQRVGVETFEDSRVDYLACQRYPGLRKLFLELHPVPDEKALELDNISLIRLRLAMVSRAILDPDYQYENEVVREFVDRFFAEMEKGESSSRDMASIALSFIARTRRQSDALPTTYFENTEVDYRDDNRHLWIYIEQGDDEETTFEHLDKKQQEEEELKGLPPRHYHEWDYNTQSYRPDWVSVYEALHPRGNPLFIDNLLAKHSRLAKRLKQMLDMLKPQEKERIRYQEEGSELDLDVAIRSLIDFKSGSSPDTRINMSHRTAGRNIAVTIVLDLSQSLSEKAEGCNQTILELSQEAVSLLAWSIDQVGDPFAISGFHSNTRHDVRFYHIKGFGEKWSDEVKSRIAKMEAGYSTRMGAAMRHAGHYLKAQQADKKLMLILTDGEPADIDVNDEQLLIQDARKAVNELDLDGIYSYCINLDPKADEYVSDIFGRQYTIIDHIDRLPEKLPELFISLTK
ncbi:von Willebrand factor type A domain-containing protein [Mariprofundus ferrinatatus]|uniref:von Willebrand factor type A domain-containing protein n=1 Tax=Mariprofundus ferrinatatus TaxID=1921087 RepID=A0A2K8LA09_9PROT|nr:VWA domain-containing protein [Mariprofundus ferrinatatus]ATX81784.1 von Willebrand factor type A domain-containing protein [Mariprofundus ferrinatatus]